MTTPEALFAVVLALGGLAAAGFEIWLAQRGHPHRFAYGWCAWTPLAMGVVAAVVVSTGAGAGWVITAAALVGPALYPIARVFIPFYLEIRNGPRIGELLPYRRERPLDFGAADRTPTYLSQARFPSVMPDPPPLRVRAMAIGLSGGVLFVGSAFLLTAGPPGDWTPSREAMTYAELEARGYAAARLEPDPDWPDCIRWSALGARGQACPDLGGSNMRIWVQETWSPAPPVTTP